MDVRPEAHKGLMNKAEQLASRNRLLSQPRQLGVETLFDRYPAVIPIVFTP